MQGEKLSSRNLQNGGFDLLHLATQTLQPLVPLWCHILIHAETTRHPPESPIIPTEDEAAEQREELSYFGRVAVVILSIVAQQLPKAKGGPLGIVDR